MPVDGETDRQAEKILPEKLETPEPSTKALRSAEEKVASASTAAGTGAGAEAAEVAVVVAATVEARKAWEMVLVPPDDAEVIYIQSIFRGALVRQQFKALKVRNSRC